ncbi:hypothetical protein D3C80_1784190 [compost metagenome]
MTSARGTDGINGDAGVAVGTVFETDRARERRGHFTVDLAFGGASANRAPADQVGNILADHHIQELGRRWQAKLVH